MSVLNLLLYEIREIFTLNLCYSFIHFLIYFYIFIPIYKRSLIIKKKICKNLQIFLRGLDCGNKEMVELLVDFGVFVKEWCMDNSRHTYLNLLVNYDRFPRNRIAKVLIKHGVTVDIMNNNVVNKTPFELDLYIN